MVVRLLCIGILLLIFSCDRKDDNYEDLLLNNYTRVKFPKLEYDKVDYYVFDDRLTDLDSLRLVSNYEYSFIDTLGNIYNTIKPKYMRYANLAARLIVKDFTKFFETKDDFLTLSLGSRYDFFSRQI